MSKYVLTKSRLLHYRQCPKRLWLSEHKPDLAEFDPATEQIFDQGHLVGDVARQVFGGGALIEFTGDPDPAIEHTNQLLTAKDPIYEATFLHDEVLIRSDVLYPDNGSCRVIEVKQSTSVKETYADDCAIQSWVIERAGYRTSGFSIAHIDNTFVYPGAGNYSGLFKVVPMDQEVAERQGSVPEWVADAKDILGARRAPVRTVGAHCRKPYDCPFIEYCSLEEPDFSVKKLPNAKKLVEQLESEGITDIRDIPEGRLDKPLHQRIWRSVQSGRYELSPEATRIAKSFPYPRYYFDFETINFAIPIWPGTRPYVQHPFQWSCHIEIGPGRLQHDGFLDISGDNPVRGCAEELLKSLGNEGPIFVYFAAFEKTRLQEMAALFPDLAPRLQSVIDRLYDLLPLMKEHYYHPELKGSWSIKKVLPTIAPDLDYASLGEVSDGGGAQRAYLKLIDPQVGSAIKHDLRQKLLAYCQLDTMAMVRIVQFLSDPPAP